MASYTTLDAARAAYLANADYADGAGDLAKAQDFRSACRALLVLMPQSAGQGGSNVTMSMAEVAKQLAAAESFVGTKASATAPRAIYTNVSEFRS
ncbi:MAG TPA: hypothetical protein PK280_17415 [Planctomycetota bacterium]|nr:hypothetical protein [Planctomycetota bacterium]